MRNSGYFLPGSRTTPDRSFLENEQLSSFWCFIHRVLSILGLFGDEQLLVFSQLRRVWWASTEARETHNISYSEAQALGKPNRWSIRNSWPFLPGAWATLDGLSLSMSNSWSLLSGARATSNLSYQKHEHLLMVFPWVWATPDLFYLEQGQHLIFPTPGAWATVPRRLFIPALQ